jgi:hypothetical protein
VSWNEIELMPRPLAGVRLEAPSSVATQAACSHVWQSQSAHTQEVHGSPPQCEHAQVAWLQVAHVQSAHSQTAQLSVQSAHAHFVHSS